MRGGAEVERRFKHRCRFCHTRWAPRKVRRPQTLEGGSTGGSSSAPRGARLARPIAHEQDPSGDRAWRPARSAGRGPAGTRSVDPSLAEATRPEPRLGGWPMWVHGDGRVGHHQLEASPSAGPRGGAEATNPPARAAPPTSRPTDVGPTGLASQRRPPRARGRGWPTPTGPPRPPRAGLSSSSRVPPCAPVGRFHACRFQEVDLVEQLASRAVATIEIVPVSGSRKPEIVQGSLQTPRAYDSPSS